MAQKLDQEGWEGFVALCVKAKSLREFNKLFDLFCTREEKETLAKRFLIVKALEAGALTQRKIAKKFHVSIAQITRGSNALKIVDAELKKFLENSL